jgi:hypothetical protein
MQDSHSVPAPGSDSPTNQSATSRAAKQKRNRAFYSYLLVWLR